MGEGPPRRVQVAAGHLTKSEEPIVAGVDICKGGWVAVVLGRGPSPAAQIFSSLRVAAQALAEAGVIAVDVPIRLPAPGSTRSADLEAKKAIGNRRNSVFATPPRRLLDQPTVMAANLLARELGITGISAQSFALKWAIQDVESVALEDPRIIEVHPEVSFWAMGGGRHLLYSKKSWTGMHDRALLLADQGVVLPANLGEAGAAGVGDVLDAAAAAWSARRVAAGIGRSLPDPPEVIDGREVAIFY